MINDYRDLEVWKQAMVLCETVYGIVRKFPTDERYALGDQLRRTAGMWTVEKIVSETFACES